MRNTFTLSGNSRELDDLFTFTDGSGKEVLFEFWDQVDYRGNEFIVLLPQDVPEDERAFEILMLESLDVENKEEHYVSVDDQETTRAVYAIFRERYKDYFDYLLEPIDSPSEEIGSDIEELFD